MGEADYSTEGSIARMRPFATPFLVTDAGC